MRVLAAFVCAAGIAAGSAVAAAADRDQTPRPATLRIRAVLVDSDLNLKPVARHVMVLDDTPSKGAAQRIVLDFDGRAEVSVPPGRYILQSERPVEFQGKTYRWRMPLDLQAGETRGLDLAGDNATVEAPPVTKPTAAPTGAGSFVGDWSGSYAGLPATLTLDRLDAQTYRGTLFVVARKGSPSTELEVEVGVNGAEVTIKEVKVANLGAVREWNLGSSAGKLDANAREMSGSGKDSRGTSFKWSFTRK